MGRIRAMNRRKFLWCLGGATAVSAVGAPAHADPVEAVVNQLRQQGYRDVQVNRTLLGRARITGTRRGGLREIVLDPRTGEILRDLETFANGAPRSPVIADRAAGAGADGSTGTGTAEDDDDGDDEDSSELDDDGEDDED